GGGGGGALVAVLARHGAVHRSCRVVRQVGASTPVVMGVLALRPSCSTVRVPSTSAGSHSPANPLSWVRTLCSRRTAPSSSLTTGPVSSPCPSSPRQVVRLWK